MRAPLTPDDLGREARRRIVGKATVGEFGRQWLAAETADYRKPTNADFGPHRAHHLMPSGRAGLLPVCAHPARNAYGSVEEGMVGAGADGSATLAAVIVFRLLAY